MFMLPNVAMTGGGCFKGLDLVGGHQVIGDTALGQDC